MADRDFEVDRPADRGYAAGARAGLPFAVATLLLGASFGVLARQLGWGVAIPIVFSMVVFSGSAPPWPRCSPTPASCTWAWP